jgi:hypothetical protein
MRRGILTLAVLLTCASAAHGQPQPITEVGGSSAPKFLGEPFAPLPLVAPDPPRHPHMARNGESNLHVDAFQTDVHQVPGPLGNGTTRSSISHVADCASVTFDSKGRIVTVCVSVVDVTLHLKDPKTLESLATFALPKRQPSANMFQNFTGGGYFYLDDKDRAIIPTTSRHVFVMKATDPPGFAMEADHDLTAHVVSGDAIISALPDWTGRIWFASKNGVVGTIDRAGAIKSIATGEPITNSFAVDADGTVFIVTDKALYRFQAGDDNVPKALWSHVYDNDGRQKPGQTQAGSGTTPTLIGRDRVAITDNADPINVVVYDRTGPRISCKVPVFEKGASSTDQSLIATPDLIVVENNHGYTGPTATEGGKTTTPGLAKIDLHPSGRGCKLAWTSQEIAPSVVPKLSAATGLVYTYTKPPTTDGSDPWYLTGIDVRTGKTAFKALAGDGLGFNNNYAPVTLGPDGTAYVGVLGGLVALRDAEPPPATRASAPSARLKVTCSGSRVTGNRVLRVVFTAGRKKVVDGRAPFKVRMRATRARIRVEGGAVLSRGDARRRARPRASCRRAR